ncbi:nucleotide exchange factor GrpE [Pontiella sp.]|uniref:nucleotide exchange factor GrpE n=1 Tax=Pontiella sp. TaxID=2837462 RepID=UPI0035677F6D
MAKDKNTKNKNAEEERKAAEAAAEAAEKLEELPDTEVIEEEETAAAVETEEEDESLRDQFVRLQADFANFRNRTQRERIELYQRANEDLLLEVLPVLDHYEMGLQTAEQHHADKAVVDGFKMVYDQFQNVLKKFNLEPIEAVGQPFDPHKHEALTHMPSDKFPAEVCSNQVRRGYMFGDKLLRAAQVVVSSGPADNAAEGGE